MKNFNLTFLQAASQYSCYFDSRLTKVVLFYKHLNQKKVCNTKDFLVLNKVTTRA